jgi:hypothetical protein
VSRLREIQPGLWRWVAPHPAWHPDATPESVDDWPREVGSVLVEAPDATVFIDPLLPARGEAAFLDRLDRMIRDRGRPVAVLTTIGFHRRSRDQLANRYEASTSRGKGKLPSGIEPLPIRGAGETMFWLAEYRTLVPGDRIIGTATGGLRICPESWLRYLPSGVGVADLRPLLRPLLDLPIDSVLVSHGDPVIGGGRAALATAIAG